jgi:PmbA protein
MREQLLQKARSAARVAQQAGADDARAYVLRSREVRVELRDGELDRIRESTRQGLYITLYVNGRYSNNSTSDIRDESVADFVRRVAEGTQYLTPDEHRHLPDPARYRGQAPDDLQLYDPTLEALSPKRRIESAKQLEQSARAADRKNEIVSVTSSVSDRETLVVGMATNGLVVDEKSTSFSYRLQCTVAGADDRRPAGYSYASARHASELPSPQLLGRDAFERAAGQLDSRQVPTGRYQLVIENRAAPRLAWQLFGPLSGRNIQQRRSFLEGMLNETVGSRLLQVTDDPHLPRALGSTAWDNEGMATARRKVFEGGKLRAYFLDTYYASKLGVEPTTGSFTNLVWGTGSREAKAILAALDEGIYVTSFLGGNSNATTGDFSLGIKGYYVKNGEIVHPVSEMNVAGNHLELWKRLEEVGNDPWRYGTNRVPSLRFRDVSCSGSQG